MTVMPFPSLRWMIHTLVTKFMIIQAPTEHPAIFVVLLLASPNLKDVWRTATTLGDKAGARETGGDQEMIMITLTLLRHLTTFISHLLTQTHTDVVSTSIMKSHLTFLGPQRLMMLTVGRIEQSRHGTEQLTIGNQLNLTANL